MTSWREEESLFPLLIERGREKFHQLNKQRIPTNDPRRILEVSEDDLRKLRQYDIRTCFGLLLVSTETQLRKTDETKVA